MRNILGFLLLLSGFMMLFWHVYEYFVSGFFEPMLFGTFWFKFHPESLQLFQPAVERYLDPILWHSVIAPVLNFWLFAVLLFFAVLLLLPTWLKRN